MTAQPTSTPSPWPRWPCSWKHLASEPSPRDAERRSWRASPDRNGLRARRGAARRGGNARIDFLEEPIVAYEVGYTRDGTDFPRLHEILDHAARFHLTLNTFYHPVYVAEWPTCRQAIVELGRYLAQRQLVAAHLGNDALWRWWDARHRSAIHRVVWADGELRFEVLAAATEGVIVTVPILDTVVQAVEVDGRPSSWTLGQELGQSWAFVIVPAGDHRVAVRTSVR